MPNKYDIIIVWFKRIFSIQTISLIVSIIAAYFTYQAYVDSRPSTISVELPSLNSSRNNFIMTDASNVSHYWSLGFHTIPPVSINDGAIGGVENILLFPIIENKSSKSIQNFQASISISWNDCMSDIFKDQDVINDKAYNIESIDNNSVEMSYKSDILAANAFLPYPFRTLHLFMANEQISTEGGDIEFIYHVNYDGAEKPIRFKYTARMFYSENFSKKFIGESKYRFYDKKTFTNWFADRNYNDGEWVIIDENYVYRNIKHLSNEQYKALGAFKFEDLQEN